MMNPRQSYSKFKKSLVSPPPQGKDGKRQQISQKRNLKSILQRLRIKKESFLLDWLEIQPPLTAPKAPARMNG